jgi:Flp pilus assembly protein TadD
MDETAPSDAPKPDAAMLTAEVGRAIQAQDFDTAFRLAGRAVEAGAVHPLPYRLHGAELERQGRRVEAVAMFQRALSLAPDDAATLNALGFSQAKLGHLAEATATLRKAQGLSPQFAPVPFNLGWVLEQQGRLAAAEAAYGEALRLDPEHMAAMANLAVLQARKSRWASARGHAQAVLGKAALGKAPGQAVAHLALAMCDLGEGRLEAAKARLQTMVAAPALPVQERAVALNLLGETLDKLGETKGAYDAYTAANLSFRQLFGMPSADAAPTGLALVRQLQAQLDDPNLATAPREPAAGAAPVFLLSFPRSATTLTGQILAAHADVIVSDEQELLSDAAVAFLTPADGLHQLARAEVAGLQSYRRAYWRRVRETGPDAADLAAQGKVFIDKLPMNTLALPVIARLFPGATIIFMVRDPRDVVWSCFRQRFIGSGVARDFTDLERAAALYDAVMTLAQTCFTKFDLDVRFQRYERLVSDFEGETAALCGFLGLAFDPAMGDFAAAAGDRDVATPSAVQIARGLNPDSIGQWRRYAGPMSAVMPALAPWVETFGYESA